MDAESIKDIGTTAIGFLSSYFAKAGESTLKMAGERIYLALKHRFNEKSMARKALFELEKAPDDTDLQDALRVEFKNLLVEDESFVTELGDLLSEMAKTETNTTTIEQNARDNAKQFGQVFGNITFGRD